MTATPRKEGYEDKVSSGLADATVQHLVPATQEGTLDWLREEHLNLRLLGTREESMTTTTDKIPCPNGKPDHHWVLERAMPPLSTSTGVCQNCGAEKLFDNSMYYSEKFNNNLDLSNGKKEQHKRRPAGRKPKAQVAAKEEEFEAELEG
jgi:hypothetical protein